ncbi:MAG: hypothetical protein LBG58_01125, partial [Planctomycetaceae bacterium]|nr:hypothetical protein [Planctomycetaceae bacterium]
KIIVQTRITPPTSIIPLTIHLTLNDLLPFQGERTTVLIDQPTNGKRARNHLSDIHRRVY